MLKNNLELTLLALQSAPKEKKKECWKILGKIGAGPQLVEDGESSASVKVKECLTESKEKTDV